MAAYNDASVPFGSQVITIGLTSYVAENIAFNAGTTAIERRDANGNPQDQVLIDNFDTGTAVLQFATTLTVIPARGATFTLTRTGGATAGCILSETGEAYTQLDAKKVNISFRRRYAS